MKLVVLTGGTNGDVRPFLALGKRLKQAGHTVHIATYDMYESTIHEHGLEFVSYQFDIVQAMQSEAGAALGRCGDSFWCSFSRFVKVMEPGFPTICDSALAACQDADGIICSAFGGHFGPTIARELNIPYITAFFQPVYPTSSFAHALAPAFFHRHNLGSIANSFTQLVGDFIFWYPCKNIFNQWTQERFNKPWSGFFAYRQQLHPSLCAVSPSVLPKPAGWSDDISIPGYWFLDEAEQWQAPKALTAFLEAGSPPVVAGFGSMQVTQETVENIVKALKQTQQRGILLKGWGNLDLSSLPDNIFVADEIPHDWIYPKASLVINHGGAGSTAAAFRAGTPILVVPFGFDQPFWGQRAIDLGVSPNFILHKDLNVENLSLAINAVVNDKAMQQRAASLGERIRAEDGLGHAVEVIKRTLKN
ncbi:glycosyltransferase [Candidatus Albibeggiatoa sp. nov. BB20]|uniref:glycosyltransferase n=1 Tax=Candidatus Albibeggiatoa sp. nov. BB20 TaxID=3162723 RepID=UPI0033654C8E